MNLSFSYEITKAEEVDGKLYLAGVASTTDIDAHRERMTNTALADMAKTAVGVPLTNSHKNELENNIGTIVEAKVETDSLMIKAEIDADDASAVRLWKKVQKGHKAAFSVGGKVTSDRPSVEKGAQRLITGVHLDHIMLTAKPANQNTFAVALAKSIETLDAEDLETQGKDTTKQHGDHMDQDDLEKSGAKLSADSKASLKGIHDAGNADVKAKVRTMLGDDATEVLGAPADDTAETNAADTFIGVIDKTEAKDDVAATVLSKEEQTALIKTELGKALREALAEITVKPKGSDEIAPLAKTLDKMTRAEMWDFYRESNGIK